MAVGVVLVAIMLGLAWQNRSLSAKLRERENQLVVARAAAKGKPVLRVGESIVGLRGVDGAGQPMGLFEGDPREVLVFVASPTCDACEQERTFWRGLVASADRARWRSVVVMSNGLASSAEKFREVGCEAMAVPNALQTPLAELPVVPSVIRAGADGVIRGIWLGVPSGSDRAEIVGIVRGGAEQPRTEKPRPGG